jgi:hypothetical protein
VKLLIIFLNSYQMKGEEVYHNTDVNSAFNYFLSTFLNMYEASFPIIYVSNSNDKSWITTGIKISCQCKEFYITSVSIVVT